MWLIGDGMRFLVFIDKRESKREGGSALKDLDKDLMRADTRIFSSEVASMRERWILFSGTVTV